MDGKDFLDFIKTVTKKVQKKELTEETAIALIAAWSKNNKLIKIKKEVLTLILDISINYLEGRISAQDAIRILDDGRNVVESL